MIVARAKAAWWNQKNARTLVGFSTSSNCNYVGVSKHRLWKVFSNLHKLVSPVPLCVSGAYRLIGGSRHQQVALLSTVCHKVCQRVMEFTAHPSCGAPASDCASLWYRDLGNCSPSSSMGVGCAFAPSDSSGMSMEDGR